MLPFSNGTSVSLPTPLPTQRLQHVVEHASHVLPAQGPITVFIHHNTLHAFEDLTFEEAVKKGQDIFQCQPYLPEENYREALGKGRIRFTELQDVLREDLERSPREPAEPLRLTSRYDLRLAMLQHSLRDGTGDELRWFVEETDALGRICPDVSPVVRSRMIAETRRWVMRHLRTSRGPAQVGANGHAPPWLPPLFEQFGEGSIESWDEDTWEAFTLQALWEICREGVCHAPAPSPAPLPIRHRDLVLLAQGPDTDVWVHDILIRFSGAFLDQGISHWSLPERDAGYFRSFLALYSQPGGVLEPWQRALPLEIHRLLRDRIGPIDCLHDSLSRLGVMEPEWDAYLSATLVALRGWGGMVRQVEVRGDRIGKPIPQGSLIEFLAIRLLLERMALEYAAREHLGIEEPLHYLRERLRGQVVPKLTRDVEQRAFAVFQLAQHLGWTPEELNRQEPIAWTTLVREIESFSAIERRRIFHLAFEKRFRITSLDALALHRPRKTPAAPRFQTINCLDEREESFRRHLEEVAPDVETFAAAGFFNVAMYYRGAADAHFTPRCPVVIRPQHWVAEQVDDAHEEMHRRQSKTRQALGAASHGFDVGSRTFALGALLTASFGVLASVPLVARILFPRLTALAIDRITDLIQTPPKTRLKIERTGAEPGSENGQLGFSPDEMASIAERLLREIGLTSQFARIVLILGHGSASLNNPHQSAYDCGACGGSAGGPNARAIAHALNDLRIRQMLAQRGLTIPDTTVFVGGLHNTCNDSVTLYDVNHIPESHRAEFARIQEEIRETCTRNAHERCRRFHSASTTMTFAEAHRHVEERAEDLAQTRPELGHATNALCIVGRRQRTRGLYLDRRAFLSSYDPTQDTEDRTILTRILQAAVPVCAGINLEYYFSRVDSAGWGCGSKLPHNVSALLGVMDGAASDLRTGLPWQMAEIHEPVRLLFIIEAPAQALLSIMDREPAIGKLCRNGWIQVAVLDPDSSRVQLFKNGVFRDYVPQDSALPTAPSSVDWYRGCRDHLEFAVISETP